MIVIAAMNVAAAAAVTARKPPPGHCRDLRGFRRAGKSAESRSGQRATPVGGHETEVDWTHHTLEFAGAW